MHLLHTDCHRLIWADTMYHASFYRAAWNADVV